MFIELLLLKCFMNAQDLNRIKGYALNFTETGFVYKFQWICVNAQKRVKKKRIIKNVAGADEAEESQSGSRM